MTGVVFVTQVLDPDDPVLGFVCRQVEVLRSRVDRVVVVANEVRRVPAGLDVDVVSLGKERGANRVERLARYQLAVAHAGRKLDRGVLVAHMCPIYLLLAAPVTEALRMRRVLWYVHPSNTRRLRAAERMADAVITAVPASYPNQGSHVHAIGHAIDVDAFAACRPPVAHPLRVLALGRTSPVKGYDVLLRATAKALAGGSALEVRIVGPASNAAERAHRDELRQMIDDLALGDVVRLEDGVPRRQVPDLMSWASVVVNLTRTGSADKVVFEAMAARRPVLVSTDAFDDLLTGFSSLRFEADDVGHLAARLSRLAELPAGERRLMGDLLQSRVEERHSLGHWADQVVALSERLTAPGSPPAA